MTDEAQQIVDEPTFEWRCGAVRCFYRPLLGLYGIDGGAHIHNGRSSRPIDYLVDLKHGCLLAHCPSCHEWRELHRDPETGLLSDRLWTGYVPSINCKCEFQRVIDQLAEEVKHATMAEGT